MMHLNDGLGRLLEVQETGAGQTWRTRFRHDLSDNVVQTVDSQSNEKCIRYDGLGRRIFLNDPDRGLLYLRYDDASNLILSTDAKGQEIAYTHDGANRWLTEEYRGEATTPSLQQSPDLACHYDKPNPGGVDQGDRTIAVPENTRGRLSWVRDLSGEQHNSYDVRRRLCWNVLRVRFPDPAIHALVSYRSGVEYDAMDRVTTRTYPDNDRVVFQYNNRNLPERIPAIAEHLDYLPSGLPEICEYGNGVVTECHYDPRLRLVNLRTRAPEGTSEQTLLDYDYTFDGASNITRIEHRRTHVSQADPRHNSQSFKYDDLYRLISVQWSDQKRIGYACDRTGNMTGKSSPASGPGHAGDPDVNVGTMVFREGGAEMRIRFQHGAGMELAAAGGPDDPLVHVVPWQQDVYVRYHVPAETTTNQVQTATFSRRHYVVYGDRRGSMTFVHGNKYTDHPAMRKFHYEDKEAAFRKTAGAGDFFSFMSERDYDPARVRVNLVGVRRRQ